MSIIALILAAVGVVVVVFVGRSWMIIYNKFIYWRTRAEKEFAGIDVIMQERYDMISALAQTVKKYDIHEYKALKDVVEARSRWSKDLPLNERVRRAEQTENNFIKIQRMIERYPNLKGIKLHEKIMGHGNISHTEHKLRKFRLSYNYTVEQYNRRVMQYPRAIVAKVHGFKKLDYLNLGNKVNIEPHEQYTGKTIFNDEE